MIPSNSGSLEIMLIASSSSRIMHIVATASALIHLGEMMCGQKTVSNGVTCPRVYEMGMLISLFVYIEFLQTSGT